MIRDFAEYLKVEGHAVRVLEQSATAASSFWPTLCELAPWLALDYVNDQGLKTRETKLGGSFAHGPISFVGDIEPPQLGVLVETLRALATGEPEWESVATKAELLSLERTVELDVIVSALCPFCATVSAAALRFATISPSVAVRVQRADAIQLPEGVHTLPTVLADGAIVANGAIDEYTLVRQVFVYQRSFGPTSGVGFSAPSCGHPELKKSGPVSGGSAPSRRPRRPTAA